jgi:thiazole synthase
MRDSLVIAGRVFQSRLLVGTGKYADFAQMRDAIEASGAEIVTVALRRVSLAAERESIEAFLDPKRYTYLPNSAGCMNAQDAVRTLRLAREAGGWTLVKLEVMGDATTLYPDVEQTLKAAEILVKDGFGVMAYTNDDPVVAKKLEDAGCVAVMPLGAPIGSGLGIQNPLAIRAIVERAQVPVLVDAGVGTASDAAIAMELGCDGVLLNTAIAEAHDPVKMAEAMKHAVIAGRLAYRAGRMKKREAASPSSPIGGVLTATARKDGI